MLCVVCKKAERHDLLYLCEGCIANLKTGTAPLLERPPFCPQNSEPLLTGGGGIAVEQSRRAGTGR